MKVQSKDLELAKKKLTEEDLSLVIVKKGKVLFRTKKHGIKGFLDAIERLGKKLVEASAADKIVGVAAAMLSLYSGMASVFASTISEEGLKVLIDSNIVYEYENTVPNILNRNKNGVCPFEKIAMASGNPEEAYVKLQSCVRHVMVKNKKLQS